MPSPLCVKWVTLAHAGHIPHPAPSAGAEHRLRGRLRRRRPHLSTENARWPLDKLVVEVTTRLRLDQEVNGVYNAKDPHRFPGGGLVLGGAGGSRTRVQPMIVVAVRAFDGKIHGPPRPDGVGGPCSCSSPVTSRMCRRRWGGEGNIPHARFRRVPVTTEKHHPGSRERWCRRITRWRGRWSRWRKPRARRCPRRRNPRRCGCRSQLKGGRH